MPSFATFCIFLRGEKEEKGGENRSCLFVEFRKKSVEPFPTEAEPASCTDLLASESKYKIPISVTSERKSDIHVFQVAITALPGIAQGSPDGQYVGILEGIGLTHPA